MARMSLLFLIIILVSCSNEHGQQETVRDNTVSTPSKSELTKINVSLLNANTFKSIMEEHQGKVIFINVWATWCVPCKEEFPDLVELHLHYQNSDVVFIGISVDFKEDIEKKVKPFLMAQKATFQNYVQNFKDPSDLINLLNKDWRGAVPATFIYDKKGHQQAYLLGRHSFEEFQAKIEAIRKMN
jgi:thiol-disulfide isomerase/thioredoxin